MSFLHRLWPVLLAAVCTLRSCTLENATPQPQPDKDAVVFKVREDYTDALASAAYAKTGDKVFQRPKGENVLWHPWPSKSLKALGLTFENGSKITLSNQSSVLHAKGSDAWLRKLEKIHRDYGIFFERTNAKR